MPRYILLTLALFVVSCVTADEYCRRYFEAGSKDMYHCVEDQRAKRARALNAFADSLSSDDETVTECEKKWDGKVVCKTR